MSMQDLEGVISEKPETDNGVSPIRRKIVFGTLGTMGLLLTSPQAIAQPEESTLSEDGIALYRKIKSMPRGRVPLTAFPEIIAGIGKSPPRIIVDYENHTPPEKGIDFEVNSSFPWTPIVAPAQGVVTSAKFFPDSGYKIVISHGGYRGYHSTLHGHLNPLLLVQIGDVVERGTLIGFGSNTGTNAKGIFHYHIGAIENGFEPPNKFRIVKNNPHSYAENSRLGTWGGNELDNQYIADVQMANQYADLILGKLPEDVLVNIKIMNGEYNIKHTSIGVKLGFLDNLLRKDEAQGYIKGELSITKAELGKFRDLKPVYTVFVNPQRLDLYHIIVH